MWQCGMQSRKIVCGQARRTESSTLQYTEHLSRIFIDQTIDGRKFFFISRFCHALSYDVQAAIFLDISSISLQHLRKPMVLRTRVDNERRNEVDAVPLTYEDGLNNNILATITNATI